MAKKLFIGFLLIGALSIIFMSLRYYQFEVTGIIKGKTIAKEFWYRPILLTHITFGLIAMSIGPFQFINRLRLSYPILHKRIGYLYVLSILLSGTAGLIVAQYAMGGWISELGFTILALTWLAITTTAIIAILKGNLKKHRLFMMLSYSLTFASIPQRTMLLLAIVTDIAFLDIYRCSAWFPWIINLIIAYIIFTYFEKRKTQIV